MVGMPTNQKTLLVTDARLAGELGGGVWLTCGYGAGTLSLRLPPSGYRGFAWFDTTRALSLFALASQSNSHAPAECAAATFRLHGMTAGLARGLVRLPWPSVGRNLGTVGWRVDWGVAD
jgi:hypothetical protein